MQNEDNKAILEIIKFHKSWAYKWLVIGLVAAGIMSIPVYFGDIKGFEATVAFAYFIVFILTFRQVAIEVKGILYWKKFLT